jgi:NADPH2:quinone reductase
MPDISPCQRNTIAIGTQERSIPKAPIMHVKGGPENFVWEDVAIPAPGGGEVHIRTHPIGVNFADIYHRSGTPHPLVVGDPPIIVGNEAVASVVAVGPGVHEFKAGDKIATSQPPIGAYAEERLYPVEKLIKIPDDLGLTDQELASVLIRGLTAQFLLHETYQVKPGETVLMHAAAGGMEHTLCPWARHLGATVIGTVSTEEKTRKATELGCHHTINYSTGDFEERVRDLTNGEGVHIVYESIGKVTLAKSLRCIRRRGMCVADGHASGVPDPVDIVKQLGEPRSLYITRPAIWH